MTLQFTHEGEFTFTRSYRGPIRCVILDWAGTTMDFGCMAPAIVFRQVFAKAGVPNSLEEARVPMGAHKRVHISLICEIPSVRRRWVEKPGIEPTDADVETMFTDFVPMKRLAFPSIRNSFWAASMSSPTVAAAATKSV
jgi:phosphonoacetaldehyde hydrolase